MNRTIEYHIKQEELPQNVSLTIKGYLKDREYSAQNRKELKQDPYGILLNGVPAHMNAPLSAGDLLRIQICEQDSSENILPIPLPLDIVYEDEDLLVLNKPAGMPTHPSQNNRDNTLANALAYYYQQRGMAFIFRCINRLDRDTSGLTIVAKHYVSAGILGKDVAEKSHLKREYLAIVPGTVTPCQGTISAPLGRKPGSIIERCVDPIHGESAVTHYRVLEEKNGYSLVSLILETGRTHQIRIHMKHIGHPLAGDYLYNPEWKAMESESVEHSAPISRQALHSHRLSFRHPITGEAMEFTAPMPEDMCRLLGE